MSDTIQLVKKKIFPIYVNDVYISYPTDLLTLVKFSSAKIDTSNIKKSTIEYLLKIYKFMDSTLVYSLANEPEIDFIHSAIKDIYKSNIPGDIIEAGVWRGGMGIWMNYLVHEYSPEPRKIWLFDSYDGFPEPKHPKDLYVHPVTKILYGENASIEQVKTNFEMFGLLTQNLCFVKGEFEKSASYVDIDQISILHLDCDYYDPTLVILEKYYPRMAKNGYVIVNQYFYEYVNIKAAIDEFRIKYQIQSPIQKLGSSYAYWRV